MFLPHIHTHTKLKKNTTTKGYKKTGRWWMCLLPWLWWWYHGVCICPNSSNFIHKYVQFFVYISIISQYKNNQNAIIAAPDTYKALSRFYPLVLLQLPQHKTEISRQASFLMLFHLFLISRFINVKKMSLVFILFLFSWVG